MRYAEHDTALTLRVPAETKAELQALAARRDVPMADIIRTALTDHLRRERRARNPFLRQRPASSD